MVPDFEFIAAQARSAVSSHFPAQSQTLPLCPRTVSKDFPSRFQAKSKRAQLLLKVFEDCKGSQISAPEKPNFDLARVLEKPSVLLVTVDRLTRALEYLEAGTMDWHLERGLQPEFKLKSDVMVMTSKDKDLLGNLGNTARGYRQEVYEFGTTPEGYEFLWAREHNCRKVKVHRLRLDTPNGISAFQTDDQYADLMQKRSPALRGCENRIGGLVLIQAEKDNVPQNEPEPKQPLLIQVWELTLQTLPKIGLPWGWAQVLYNM